jgi:hypothetical protein
MRQLVAEIDRVGRLRSAFALLFYLADGFFGVRQCVNREDVVIRVAVESDCLLVRAGKRGSGLLLKRG